MRERHIVSLICLLHIIVDDISVIYVNVTIVIFWYGSELVDSVNIWHVYKSSDFLILMGIKAARCIQQCEKYYIWYMYVCS